MKRSTHARKAKRSGDAVGVSLFPFLAVLICTVGALIVLLVVIGRHARVQAAQMAETQQAQTHEDIQQRLEDVRWRIGHLRQSLETTQRQLADARLELGHLEDHSRRLRRQLEEMETAWRQLDRSAADSRQAAAMEEQLQALSSRIEQMRLRVERARREAFASHRSYAVVPYEGPHGTQRRPIYLECRAESIVLQPEQIVFKAIDFEGPLGPNSPLPVALRAAREYLLEQRQFDQRKSGEPYPLLLVRPSGIHSYYAAREAMSTWESDFGYELIDEDWQLDFDPADPQLARVLREEIAAARARQIRLAMAAPRHYQGAGRVAGGPRPEYTVSASTGVVVPYGDVGELSRPDRYGDPEQRDGRSPWSSGGASSGTTASGGDHSGDPYTGADGRGSTGMVGAEPGGTGQAGDSAIATPGNASDRLPGGSKGGSWSGLSGGSSGDLSGGSPGNSPGGLPGGSPGNSPGGSPGNSPGNSTGGLSGGSAAQADSSLRSGSLGGTAALTTDSRGGAVAGGGTGLPLFSTGGQGESPTGASAGAGSPRRPGEWSPPGPAGTPSAAQSAVHQTHRRPKSLAKKRGEDWAVPDAMPELTPLTKPIRIECYADRWVLPAGRGSAGGRSIALGPRSRDAIDELVSAIWDHTEGWGIAGRGMYWRPVLYVYVFPGAEHRYSDLEALLDGSGLLIERKP